MQVKHSEIMFLAHRQYIYLNHAFYLQSIAAESFTVIFSLSSFK